MAHKENESDEIGRAAMEALEGGEDPGEFRLRDTLEFMAQYVNPQRAMKQSLNLSREWLRIMAGTSEIELPKRDWRFRDAAWNENPVYKRIGQGYLAFCQAMQGLVDHDTKDWRDKERANFAVELLTSALAPTNTLLGNPEALKRVLDTGGKSLVDGSRNMVHDILHNGGFPRQVDTSPFTLGENMAATPGSVVFRNEQLELLQYHPTTEEVYATPVILITPQINKYYFIDLSPGRSFVEYMVSEAYQPFMVSWRNPGPEHAHWSLDTYCSALLEAIDAIREITGSEQVNTLGFCAGGITMSAMLAYLAQTSDERVNAISYAVTLLDFTRPAMLGMLNSATLLDSAKSRSRRKGIIEGNDMARLFTMFRPNDLIWNYWVNNYLLGKNPPSFDILAWNDDSTNLPAELHCDFLDIFSNNLLATPGAWTTLGEPVDLGKITNDAFVTGAINDHLTPWNGCYQTTQLLGGKTEFVLSNAGHIASLVNPPGNPKSSYHTGPTPGPDNEAWRKKAKAHQGSWWEYWIKWASARSGEKIPAKPELGSTKHSPLANAPGTYVFG